jgi:plastocyanin
MSFRLSKRTLALALPVMTMVALIAFSGCGSISSGKSNTISPTATASPTASPAIAATSTTGPGDNQVNVSNFQFSPAILTVTIGTTVTWKGVSGSHTVTSDAGSPVVFDQPISQGGTVTVTFTMVGTYHYHCSIHPSMHGTIVVSAASSTPAGK